MFLQFFVRDPSSPDRETCFSVHLDRSPNQRDALVIGWLLRNTEGEIALDSAFRNADVIEVGPRLAVETPFSSNVVAIARAVDLPLVRIERSTRTRREAVSWLGDEPVGMDRMTEAVYPDPLTTFDTGVVPEPVRVVPVRAEGEAALREMNVSLGLGMDSQDIAFYTQLFRRLGRDPTDVELMQIGNGNSEHSRHWFFRGRLVIDGEPLLVTLMDIVKEPWKRNPGVSLVAFHDNAGVLRGARVRQFAPERPGEPSAFTVRDTLQHITATAETHNHPTMVAPRPGAETGAGGRIRDNRAVGRGGLVHAGLAGYAVGNLHLPGHPIPGETGAAMPSRRHASPLAVLIEGSNGVSRYGNEIGEPLLGGFTRSFGLDVDGEPRAWRKPILYAAGVGRLDDRHLVKRPAEPGMLIVRIGGPAYRIGVGGGSASSMVGGTSSAELDFKSVQRGNAEMEQRVNRVIQACAEQGDGNPIESIHDQGAGGPSNVLTELMEPAGGRVDIRRINVGDRTMSVLEIWVAEYQEGYGLLVRAERLEQFQAVCARERVPCEVLGAITGDGRVTVEDSADGTTPVDLALTDILSDLPPKTFELASVPHTLTPFVIPNGITLDEAVRLVFLLPQVGSKGFLVHKADRSVTGLVVRQQECGPMMIPVADAMVTADGFFGSTGACAAIGEQPIKTLVNPAAGARMAVAEMLTNIASVAITDRRDIRCRANWMWAAKLPGEGVRLVRAAEAMRDIMIALGIAADGGKDSLSMAAQADGKRVVAPGSLVVLGYAAVPDVAKHVTPALDFASDLYLVDFGGGQNRMGGSSLAQAFGQVGDESPDIDDPEMLARAFDAIQELLDRKVLVAYHDRSDGGLITTLAEMCLAGNVGAEITLPAEADPVSALFTEEAGMVFACQPLDQAYTETVLGAHRVPFRKIGKASGRGGTLTIRSGDVPVFSRPLSELRRWWEATSDRLELEQTTPEVAEQEAESHADPREMPFSVSFLPSALKLDRLPPVAIVRDEGVNGDREMAAAFYAAGAEPHDITMSDLIAGRVANLDGFKGIVFPGGFSFADALGSGKGWAASVRYNARVSDAFDAFFARPDTFSLGVCNGFQVMSHLWDKIEPDGPRPTLAHNASGRFESRWATVRVLRSPSIFFDGMAGCVLGVWVAHGEGRLALSAPKQSQVALAYVDPDVNPTERYPFNPNGSSEGWTALTSRDGRHLGMMPHPERCFRTSQWPWVPWKWRREQDAPWLRLFQNAVRFAAGS